jgi:hypothetical protein
MMKAKLNLIERRKHSIIPCAKDAQLNLDSMHLMEDHNSYKLGYGQNCWGYIIKETAL